MPARWLRELETRLDEAAEHRLLPAMTLDRYLRVTAAAYDAAFPELRGLTALEKRRRRADSRDGGMLDLPRHDPVAFATWFDSREWAGTHPWEIVFAHPHGIMLQPYRPEGEQRWGYRLWVDSLAWYVSAAEMAMALCRAKTPLVVLERDRLLATLRGEDDVRVGPDLYAVHWDDLARERPDALPHIRWNVIPHIRPITSAQRARVAHVLRTGIPPPTDLAAP